MHESGNESTSESQFIVTHTGIVALAIIPEEDTSLQSVVLWIHGQ